MSRSSTSLVRLNLSSLETFQKTLLSPNSFSTGFERFSEYPPLTVNLYIFKQFNRQASSYVLQGIIDPAYDLIDRGGKRWRPVLGMLVAEMLSHCSAKRPHLDIEKIQENFDIYQICAAGEILHNASLIVDDIEDQSKARRGGPCTYLKYGVDVALNGGNFLYFFPFLQDLLRSEASAQQRLQFCKIVNEECTKLHLGQNWDIVWHQGDFLPSSEQYFEMIRNKTSILPRLLARLMGVAISVQNQQIYEKLVQFCQKIGLAFQLKDDLLNLQENELSKGKQMIGEDIYEGKKTLIIIEAAHILLAQNRSATHTKLMQILKSHTQDPTQIAWAIEVLRQTGAISRVKQRGQLIVTEAWSELSESTAEIPMLWKLKSIGQYLIDREL